MATHEHDGPGARLRRARSARDVSQTVLARRLGISASYLSLIEAGRRPPPEGLLTSAAAELGVDPEMLRTGETSDPAAEAAALELELRFAEMVFRTGDPGAAHARFDAALTAARGLGRTDLASSALWGRGRCREGVGDADGALADYEQLWSQSQLPADLDRAWLGVALCRVYRDHGDLDRAIDVGESALALVASADDEVSLENRIALAVTLASPYSERGDLARAQYLIETALAEAEQAESPRARGSAHWQAAIVSQQRGDVSAARRHVDRAIALYSEGDDEQALGALRITSGWLHLQGATPDPGSAATHLRLALAADTVRSDTLLRSEAETELARAVLLSGSPQEAWEIARRAADRLSGLDIAQRAAALVVAALAQVDVGTEATARQALEEAVEQLHRVGRSREAAALWRELAELLAAQGQAEDALVAYRRAADIGGVRAPTGLTTRVATRRS